MRPSVRLAALMGLPVTYVWTHDSIGLGEDGPTHQPVEHLAALRAIPGLDVVRPGDANETSVAWRTVLEHTDRPAGLCLSRQNLPVLDRAEGTGLASADGAARGGYILAEGAGGEPTVIMMATGSEVQIALAARDILQDEGIPTRVVSMPCVEWFTGQDASYQEEVLPPHIRARVSVEAGVAQPWHVFTGDFGECVSLEHFGASASYMKLYEEFGFTAEHVAAAARSSLARLSTAGTRTQGASHDLAASPTPRRPTGPRRADRRGVSIWLDDISRDRLRTGNLADADPGLGTSRGVTSNPTIFATPWPTATPTISSSRIWPSAR